MRWVKSVDAGGVSVKVSADGGQSEASETFVRGGGGAGHPSAGVIDGDGSVVELLKRSPPDLTPLSRKNGGVFPIDRVCQTIEGGTVTAHGSREMPIWGRDYRIQGAEHDMDVPYGPEAYVRTRLLWPVEYLSRLQVR